MEDFNLYLAKYEMRKAERALISAKRAYEEHDYDNSAERSYYVVFSIMNAALAIKGIQRARHTGVIKTFREEFILSGKVERELSKYITYVENLRNDADYGKTRKFMNGVPEDEALCSLQRAEEFFKKVRLVVEILIKEYTLQLNTRARKPCQIPDKQSSKSIQSKNLER